MTTDGGKQRKVGDAVVWVLSAMETYRKEICTSWSSGKMAKGSGIRERKNLIDVVPHVYNPNTSKEKAGESASSTGVTQGKNNPNKETETKERESRGKQVLRPMGAEADNRVNVFLGLSEALVHVSDIQ